MRAVVAIVIGVQPGEGGGRNSDWGAGRVMVMRIVVVTVVVMVLVWW